MTHVPKIHNGPLTHVHTNVPFNAHWSACVLLGAPTRCRDGDWADLMPLQASGASRSAPPERAAASSRPPASASSHRGRGSCTRQRQHVRASSVICCRSGSRVGGPKQAGPQTAEGAFGSNSDCCVVRSRGISVPEVSMVYPPGIGNISEAETATYLALPCLQRQLHISVEVRFPFLGAAASQRNAEHGTISIGALGVDGQSDLNGSVTHWVD